MAGLEKLDAVYSTSGSVNGKKTKIQVSAQKMETSKALLDMKTELELHLLILRQLESFLQSTIGETWLLDRMDFLAALSSGDSFKYSDKPLYIKVIQ